MRTLADLNGHIHDQINRLMDPDLSGDNLKKEVDRSKALSQLAQQSIEIANTYTRAADIFCIKNTPKMLE